MPNVVIPPVLNIPVDEKQFTLNAKTHFQQFNVHVSKDLPKVLGKLCRTLNHSITNQKQSPLDIRNIWAFPAQTGIGKSIALQIYVSMLKKEASLIVVSTRAEAHSYAEYICHLSGDDNYAIAIFSGGNSDRYKFAKDVIVNPKEYRCLVITHKRMQDIANADKEQLDYYKQYAIDDEQTKARELVVIDEKLSFATHESVSIAEYSRMLDFVENALVYSKACRPLGKRSRVTKQLHAIKELLVAEASLLSDEQSAKLIEPEQPFLELAKNDLPEMIDLKLFVQVVVTRFDELANEINAVMNSKFDILKKEKEQILTLVKKFCRILQRENGDDEYCNLKALGLFKTNQAITISKFKQFYSAFGSCVVLDATATVNEFYQTASTGRLPSFDVIDVPKVRKYKNLKIFTAKGFSQSRSALCGTDEKITSNIEIYSPVISSLKSADDKLLVIGHKKFISSLEAEFFLDKSVAFTHWGNHVGKNDWNDCAKVLVIGWNYLPPLETVSEIYGAYMPSGDVTAISNITKDNIERFSTGQMAEDIIQAVMRTRARIIADDDSDCLPTEVYLMYPERVKEQAVIDTVINEFPKACVQSWQPPMGTALSNFSKPQQNAHEILLALEEHKQQGASEISWKDIRELTGFSRSTFTKATKETYFTSELETRGVKVEAINGRQKKFVF